MQLGSAFVHEFDILILRYNYVIYLFDRITFYDDVRIASFFDMFELSMEIKLKLCFIFACHCDVFLLRYNYVIYLFDAVTFLDNVRIMLYFGTFELSLEITLQIHYVFACHCDVILLHHSDVVLLHHNYVFHLFDVVTFFNNVRIMLYFGTFELRMEITL